MNKNLLKTFSIVALLVTGGLLMPLVAKADVTSLIAGFALPGVNNLIAGVANFFLMFTSWILAIAGVFLSISIYVTTHVKDVYLSVSGIQAVWVTVRDISTMFVIFGLLYFSILTILGKGGGKWGALLGKIFMAGILINFSLFFSRVAIDASNIISLQFYNAIVPSAEQMTLSQAFTQAYSKGGISNVFMSNLKIPTIYREAKPLKSLDIAAGIGFAALGGTIIMITTAFSFFAAAIAFTIRTAILLFCMALSPLYFAGMIFPQIQKDVSDKIMSTFKSQLIFMPVYLALLYIALRLISDSAFNQIFNPTVTSQTSTFGAISIGVILQYTIAILFINAPLIVALRVGGSSMKWGNEITNKLRGVVGRNTVGQLSRYAGEKFDNMAASDFAQKSRFGKGATTVLRNLRISQAVRGKFAEGENSKYGSKYSISDVEKEDKSRSKEIGGVSLFNKRLDTINSTLANPRIAALARSPLKEDQEKLKSYREAVEKIGTKELENIDFDTLKNPVFAANLSSKQADSVTDGDFLTPQQKDEFKTKRREGLTEALTSGNNKTVEAHMKKVTGKELAKLDKAALIATEVMDNYTPSQLREMEDIAGDIKTKIGDRIKGLPPGTPHKAKGFINGHKDEWTT